jgi:Cytochrome P450
MVNILFTISASLFASILYALYQEFLSPIARKRKRLPPGPLGVPFLGNTDFPTVHAHKKFKEWADQYGEIYSLRLGSTNFVILNSDQVIKDLMDSVRPVSLDHGIELII